MDMLAEWFKAGCEWYRMNGKSTPTNLLNESAGGFVSVPRSWIDFIACALAVGHQIKPFPVNGNADLSTHAIGSSVKELHAAELEIRNRHNKPGYIAQPVKIGQAEPEEHPFLYARETIAHLSACKLEETLAAKNPVWLMSGFNGRSAAVSASLATDGRTGELVKQHLTGTI